ncbi:MAG: transposase [Candidatus Pacebacteria bacterium]|nr:transposase [Candidatus Paceibacterota bacterium]
MTQRSVSFSEYEFYHIYNRGTDKRVIFQSLGDYQRFLEQLYLANSTQSVSVKDIKRKSPDIFKFERGDQLVAIGAYCLMPNHFHLLATPLVENGLSKFMSKLMTGYSMYFNKKYERTGGLFEGRFKAKHADSDEYLKYLFSYIHLNPAKLHQSDWRENGPTNQDVIFNFVKNYNHSSLPEYLDTERPVATILNKNLFPEYFNNRQATQEELFTWLFYQDEFNI